MVGKHLQQQCFIVDIHTNAELFKLYKLGASIYDCEIGGSTALPRHVVIDKRGHICYLGKNLTSDKVQRIVR